MIEICQNICWCEYCGEKINKGDKYFCKIKRAMRGVARINICKKCFIRLFVELNPSEEEVLLIKKEVMLENLGAK